MRRTWVIVPSTAEKTGLLVIRVWIEETSPDHLRARITTLDDVTTREESVAVAGSIDQVEEIVALWIRKFSALVRAQRVVFDAGPTPR